MRDRGAWETALVPWTGLPAPPGLPGGGGAGRTTVFAAATGVFVGVGRGSPLRAPRGAAGCPDAMDGQRKAVTSMSSEWRAYLIGSALPGKTHRRDLAFADDIALGGAKEDRR